MNTKWRVKRNPPAHTHAHVAPSHIFSRCTCFPRHLQPADESIDTSLPLCSYVAVTSTYTKGLFDGVPDLHGACPLTSSLFATPAFRFTLRFQVATSAIGPGGVNTCCGTPTTGSSGAYAGGGKGQSRALRKRSTLLWGKRASRALDGLSLMQ